MVIPARRARRLATTSTARGALPYCLIALLLSACSDSDDDGGGTALFAPAAGAEETAATMPPVAVATDTTAGVSTVPGSTTVAPPGSTRPMLDPPPVTQPPATQPPVTQPPVTQPPVPEPPVPEPPVSEPPVMQPPVPEPPAMQPPIGGMPDDDPLVDSGDDPADGSFPLFGPGIVDGPLLDPDAPSVPAENVDALLGTVNFEWTFTDDAQRFAQTVGFTPGGVTSGNDGTELIFASDSGEFSTFACGSVQANGYFCIGSLPTNDTLLFLFELDDASVSGSGVFEFCPAAIEQSGCLDGLFSSPDGPVSVTIGAGAAAIAAVASDRDLAIDDLGSWMTGLDQADGGSPLLARQTEKPPLTRRDDQAARVRQIETLARAMDDRSDR